MPQGHSLWASNSRDPEQDFDSPSPVLWDKPFTESKRRCREDRHPGTDPGRWGRGPRGLQGQVRAVFSADVLLFRRQRVAGIQTTTSPLEASTSLSLGEESIRISWAEERFSRGWASLVAHW